MALRIFVSNSVEELAAHFREQVYLRRTPDELFTPEIAVVQSQGMSVWLNQQLADPVTANLETPFLNGFADEILSRFLSETEKPLMTEEWMFWKIFRILMSDSSSYPDVEKYLSTGQRGLKTCQLAEQIAMLYDRYQMYHPELLRKWRSNEPVNWQARLFRRISGEAVGRDERFSAFMQKEFTAAERGQLPKRVSLFGISALAPAYFEFFRRLGTLIDVWFYYLNPSLEYWSENETRKSAAHRQCRENWESLRQQRNPEEYSGGNPLLTSLGRQGQDFFRYLTSLDEEPEGEQLFVHYAQTGSDPDFQYQYVPGTPMLDALKEDILLNIYRNPASEPGDPGSGLPLNPEMAEPDGSVAIHSCHSELRQVEVLYDQLLNLIEKKHLEPRNILVMAPDIGKFEPYIQAVFGGGESRLQNQYTIADRSQRSRNRCADTLLKVLHLMTGKFEVTAVFDLFENESVSERWHISGADLEEIRCWIAELGVHWGINGADHERHCGVNFEEFSWEQAIDRLLLGYAVAEQDSCQPADPVVPFDSSEGKSSVKIGNFIRFLQTIFDWKELFSREHTLTEWCDVLEDMIDFLFCAGMKNYQELTALRSTFSLLREQKWNDLNSGRFDLYLISYLIEKFLIPVRIPEPFLRGKITFCSLMPMRSIPMDVIAILGLDEQSFPRRDYTPGFNVISPAGQRTALERSRNSEDRYIFLEALLAAGKNLLLFYQGRDRKTNKKRPPAVPLAELIDVLNATFPQYAEKWITEHCLQAFDCRYYTKGETLFSYSADNFRGAESFFEFRNAAAFRELPGEDFQASCRIKYPSRIANWDPGQEPETLHLITPGQLEKFYRNPCQFFLETAVGLRKHYEMEAVLEDAEKPVLDELARYRLRSLMLNQIQSGLEAGENQYQLLKKTNRLPVGAAGKFEYDSALAKIRQIPADWMERYMRSCGSHVSLQIDGLRIEGEIPVSEVDQEPYVVSRSSSSIARDLIALRLRHLILCAAGRNVTAHFWDQKECRHLPPLPVETAQEKLQKLIQYFKEGHYRPLPFFPNSSYTVSPERKDWFKVKAFRTAFTGGYLSGDYDDPAVRLIFTENALDEGSPFLEEFGQIASAVFGFAKGSGKKKELKKDE